MPYKQYIRYRPVGFTVEEKRERQREKTKRERKRKKEEAKEMIE